ncbi:SgcJ/EcaC family oxidoreductase [Streptomyces ipomoeae]|uniref:SgcJ/EcaC family oxidoreductase n=1 Tax=Streptomyces ipomoeae TaxID=103232 RepID=UPI001146A369|nr:SgcJ/EcaC family oxidoreductase [Streptomyces ipomoeae]MDX2935333.1 SgcJ/EcaC family oxidoreductase [Streptomyces ipomoeae]TQE15021.1 SgcJ/EcaC family oxidoreductase [Streptomyces ipomoeae]
MANTHDDAQIHALWETMARGWAEGDAALFASVFAPDCDFTTVRGEKPAGRKGIEAGHAELFRTRYASTRLTARVRSVRHPRPDLATVDAASTISAPDGTELATTDALAVVERDTNSTWTIIAFHNMVPAAPKESPKGQESPLAQEAASAPETPAASKPAGGVRRPALRHLAIVARDPERMVDFYSTVFSMRLFHRDPDGSCFLSDGYLSLALIKHRLDGDTPTGVNHFGFHIEDTAATTEALVAAGTPKPAERFTDRPFAEYRAMDPEGNWFDLSEHGYGGPAPW